MKSLIEKVLPGSQKIFFKKAFWEEAIVETNLWHMTQQLSMINSGNFKKFSITEMCSMRHNKAGAKVKEAGKSHMVEDVYAIFVD